MYCFIARSTYLASYGKELLLTSFIPVNGQKERGEGPLVLTKSFPPLWARRISRGLLFRKTRASIKRPGDILSAMGICKSSSIIYTLFTSDLVSSAATGDSSFVLSSTEGTKSEGAECSFSPSDGATLGLSSPKDPLSEGLFSEGCSSEGPCSEGTSFEGPRSQGSSFDGSCSEGASFEGSCSEGTSFEGPRSEGTSFEGSCSEGASFKGSCSEGASAEGPKSEDASFKGFCSEPSFAASPLCS